MKKIMITVAIVFAAALSQAATVNWISGALYAPIDAIGTKGSGTAAKASGGSFYFFDLTSNQSLYNTLVAMSYEDASAKIWETYGGKNLPSTADGAISAMGMGNKSQTVDNASGLHYGAVIYTYTDTNNKQWYIANIGKADVTGSGAVSVMNLGNAFGGNAGGTITSWTSAASAVPEPTSGLLLLLGIAGLALRRKHA